MRPLPSPFDDMAAGRPARVSLRSSALLGARLLTKDLAFPLDERRAFGLDGLLPDRVLTIEEQLELIKQVGAGHSRAQQIKEEDA